MTAGDIVPTILRAAPAIVIFWLLALSIRASRRERRRAAQQHCAGGEK